MKQKNLKSLITGFFIVILLGLTSEYSTAQKVTKLFNAGELEAAEQYCLKKKGEKRQECYKELADAYFGTKDYEKSAEFYAKTSSPSDGYIKIGNAFFEEKKYDTAIDYYKKAPNHEKVSTTYKALAEQYKNDGELEKSELSEIWSKGHNFLINMGDVL